MKKANKNFRFLVFLTSVFIANTGVVFADGFLSNKKIIQENNLSILSDWQNTARINNSQINKKSEFTANLNRIQKMKISKIKKIEKINKLINAFEYSSDLDGMITIDTFVQNGGGDDNFAITKYFALKKIGVSTKDMKITSVYDKNLDKYKKVLILSQGKKFYVMDNSVDSIMATGRIFHYDYLYAFNEQSYWKYL